MQFSKKRRNLIFYTLQILGWGGLFISNYMVVPSEYTEKYGPYIILSIVVSFIFGIISTSLLRQYVKRKVNLDSLDLREFFKLFISGLICLLLYVGISFLIVFFCKDIFPHPDDEYGLAKRVAMSLFGTGLVVYGWLLLYVIIKLVFKLNLEKIDRLELQSNLKESQLNTLKGQINPHFMFNSLNNIRGLMLEDVERSREMLTRLSDMLRYSLTKNDTNSIALEEELEMVDNYVEISRIQLEDRLHFVKEIDTNVLSCEIPPMIIQLLIENAIKHGISPLKKGGTVKLKVHRIPEGLSIEVSNTGNLVIAEGSTRVGLENIKKRLMLLYGPNASFSLNEMNDEVIASILIPQS